jgi:hypothetical protein
MKTSLAARLLQTLLLAVLLAGTSTAFLAQTGHDHNASQDLLQAVRDNTAKYQDVAAAEADGYQLLFGCVSGPDSGAMGLHFVNLNLVGSGVVDVKHPQIIIYEPLPNGKLKLIGADFLVFKSDWDNAHKGEGAPQLMGQLFHEFDAPNRFGLPSFYTLHVWAWKENPTGPFTNWHANVSCQAFTGR